MTISQGYQPDFDDILENENFWKYKIVGSSFLKSLTNCCNLLKYCLLELLVVTIQMANRKLGVWHT